MASIVAETFMFSLFFYKRQKTHRVFKFSKLLKNFSKSITQLFVGRPKNLDQGLQNSGVDSDSNCFKENREKIVLFFEVLLAFFFFYFNCCICYVIGLNERLCIHLTTFIEKVWCQVCKTIYLIVVFISQINLNYEGLPKRYTKKCGCPKNTSLFEFY